MWIYALDQDVPDGDGDNVEFAPGSSLKQHAVLVEDETVSTVSEV